MCICGVVRPMVRGASRIHATSGATTAAASALNPAEGVRGEGTLVFQAEVHQAKVSGRYAARVQRRAIGVQGAEFAQIAEAGAVAGNPDDRIGPDWPAPMTATVPPVRRAES